MAAGAEPASLDLGGLWARLALLRDARHARGKRYALAVVLLLVVLAKLAGEDRPSGIADWVQHRRVPLAETLGRALGVALPRAPHHNTYRRVLAGAVAPGELDRVVGEFLGGCPGAGTSAVVSIDGKTLKGTANAGAPSGAHLLAAYLPQEGIVLGQLPAGGHDNEIRVAPALLGGLDLHGKVVVGDALHTQQSLSRHILAAGADYLWVVKDNQPTLRADVELLFTADDRTVEGGHLAHDFRTARQLDKGHGRLEVRQLTTSAELTGYCDWPGLAQVFRLERERLQLRSGKQQREVVYGLTSLPPAAAPPARLLELGRAYWGIENGLHYRRDVTFHEDAIRLTQGHAGHVMATLNNLVIGLLRLAGFTNLAAARRRCAADLPTTLTLLCPAR
jgi:predicted transposase YbfD/YdcC